MIRVMTFSGIIGAVALAAVILAASSQTTRLQAAEENGNCHTVQITVDEGYGVSGTVTRRVCE